MTTLSCAALLALVALQEDAVAPAAVDTSDPWVEAHAVLQVWNGEQANGQFGWVAAGVGDVDGDGADDVLTSAPTLDVGGRASGRVYLHSGRGGHLIRSSTGAPGDQLGMTVCGLGDVDGDGVPDYAAGAPRPRPGDRPGHVRVWSGADGALLRTLTGEHPEDSFGREVESAGDWDSDGVPDLLISAPGFDGGRGAVSVYGGADGARLALLEGEAEGDAYGSTISTGGEGAHRFLVVGAMNAGEGRRGRLYVYRLPGPEEHFRVEAEPDSVNYGRFFSSVIGDVDADGVPDVYSVDFESNAGGESSGLVLVHSGADGSELLRLVGAPGDGLGIGNAVAGDRNGDGHDDLVTGAWIHGGAAEKGGQVILYSGRDGSVLRTWTGKIPGATLGFDATSLNDVDGDGHRDYLFTAAWSPVHGPRTGSVYVASGAPTADAVAGDE